MENFVEGEEIVKLRDDGETAIYAAITSLQNGAWGVLIFKVAVDSIPDVLYRGEVDNLEEILKKYSE